MGLPLDMLSTTNTTVTENAVLWHMTVFIEKKSSLGKILLEEIIRFQYCRVSQIFFNILICFQNLDKENIYNSISQTC